jgi:alkanesulfonate monooxygenase SsuD/methylene tetrahydromethanopterin reductase-like flavin-dependent oxidoreductase (luciferase family)
VGGDEPERRRRAAAIGMDLDELRRTALGGSPAEVVDRLGRFAEAGVQRMYLQLRDLSDLDQLQLVASDVVPQMT